MVALIEARTIGPDEFREVMDDVRKHRNIRERWKDSKKPPVPKVHQRTTVQALKIAVDEASLIFLES